MASASRTSAVACRVRYCRTECSSRARATLPKRYAPAISGLRVRPNGDTLGSFNTRTLVRDERTGPDAEAPQLFEQVHVADQCFLEHTEMQRLVWAVRARLRVHDAVEHERQMAEAPSEERDERDRPSDAHLHRALTEAF